VIGPKGLLAGRARVVVTNGIAYLPQVDKLLLMRGGIVLESDTYPHAMSNNDSELYGFM
jgi:ATP-binding cassette subfamily C (CFTR/MRP) protein 1